MTLDLRSSFRTGQSCGISSIPCVLRTRPLRGAKGRLAIARMADGFGIGELIPVDADDAATYVAETIDCGVGVDGIGNAVGLGGVSELV